MTFTLPSDLLAYIDSCIASGRFKSPQCVVEAALRQMQEEDVRHKNLRRRMESGGSCLDDECITLTNDEKDEQFSETKIHRNRPVQQRVSEG